MLNSHKQRYLLFILPLFYLVATLLVLHRIWPIYTVGPDPYYAYLMNGTNLASGYMEIGHIDHPGTPVQCFAAIIIFITHLFIAKGPVYQDVLLHPEIYLLTCSLASIIVFVLLIYFTGKYVYRHTGSSSVAILFQLMPLLMHQVLFQTFSIRPETFMVCAGVFFMGYFYVNFIYTTKQNPDANPSGKQIIICGMFIGLLIAIKITDFPLGLLPFLMLQGVKNKIKFVIATIASFFFFIIPALPKFSIMFKWFLDLATHSGKYGHGNTDIVNADTFRQNLVEIFKYDIGFTVIYLLITVALIVSIFRRLTSKTYRSNIYYRCIMPVWLTASIVILLVAKHNDYHYLFPAGLLFPMGLVCFAEICGNILFVGKTWARYSFLSAILAINLWLYTDGSFGANLNYASSKLIQKFVADKKNIPLIITSGCESAFPEPALNFGVAYSGNMRGFYLNLLKKQYPYSYQFIPESFTLTFWGEETSPASIFKNHPTVLVYFHEATTKEYEAQLDKLTKFNDMILGSYKQLFSTDYCNEYIYEIDADTALCSSLMRNYQSYSSDLEKLTPDKSGFITNDGHSVFGKAQQVYNIHRHSGSNAILLNPDQPYGLDFKTDVMPGYYVKATVWRKALDGKGIIVLTDSTSSFYKANNIVTETGPEGWEKIECTAIIPSNFAGKKLSFYIFYPGKGEAYFDDVTIDVYSMSKPR